MNGSDRSFIRKLFGVLLRLAVVFVLGIAIALGAYYGIPLAYQGLVEPAQINTTRIEAIQDEIELARTDASDMRSETGDRLADLEAALFEQGERLAGTQAELEAAITGSDKQSRALEALSGQIQTLEDGLSALTDQLDATLEDLGQPEQELRQELAVSRAMLHLVRARLWLLESNVGLAADEAGQARELLLTAGEAASIAAAVERIDLALEEMQSTPLVAADDLEIAWKLLAEGDTEEGTNE